jgi:hypothetical protein
MSWHFAQLPPLTLLLVHLSFLLQKSQEKHPQSSFTLCKNTLCVSILVPSIPSLLSPQRIVQFPDWKVSCFFRKVTSSITFFCTMENFPSCTLTFSAFSKIMFWHLYLSLSPHGHFCSFSPGWFLKIQCAYSDILSLCSENPVELDTKWPNIPSAKIASRTAWMEGHGTAWIILF